MRTEESSVPLSGHSDRDLSAERCSATGTLVHPTSRGPEYWNSYGTRRNNGTDSVADVTVAGVNGTNDDECTAGFVDV